MNLSIPTLQFTDSLVFACCGALLLCAWEGQRSRLHFLFFGASFLLCAALSVGFADFGSYGSVWSVLGWSLAGSLFWSGFRVFDGRSVTTRPMLVLSLLPAALHLALGGAGAGLDAINAASTVAYATHEAAVAAYVLTAVRPLSRLRRLAGLGLCLIALMLLAPLVPLPAAQAELPVVFIFVTDHVTSILLTVAVLALEVEKAHAALALAARTDALTGALNRLGLAAAAEGRGEAGGVILADLDHFKRINDRFGHAAGDAVLREFADRARAVLPAGCTLSRLGGEEFGILAPGFEREATALLAERLRRAVARAPFRWNGQAIAVTVSLGTARRGADEAVHAALERADAALYEAKAGGRDRVRSAA